MQSVRMETPSSDYLAVCALAESNPVYPFPGLGNIFPLDESAFPHSGFRNLKPLELSKELSLQISRLNYHAAKLSPAIESLASINNHLANADFEQAEASIALHKKSHGLSFVVLKKELLLAVERNGLSGLYKQVKTLTKNYENTAWAVLCHYLYDVLDPTNDASRAIRSWLRLARSRTERGEWYARIIEDDALTRSSTHVQLSSALLRTSAMSLLDLVLFVWRKRNVHPEISVLQEASNRLDVSITDALNQKFSKLGVRIPSSYCLSSSLPSDIEAHIRPVFRRDRYSLKVLTQSTPSIVRELDDRYRFTEEVGISDDITLNRGSPSFF
jgi:hypothetical protein